MSHFVDDDALHGAMRNGRDQRGGKGNADVAVAAVPRPPAPTRPRHLIDLSKAPSSMEQAAAGWRGR